MSVMALGSGNLPRRILMTVDADQELWEHTVELCRGLSDAGIQIVLAVCAGRPDQRQITAAMCIGGVELALGPSRRDGLVLPQAHGWLLELADARRCDLVHLNGYDHADLPFRIPRVLAAFSCRRSWWRAVKGGDVPPHWGSYQHQVSSALAAADCVVAPSAWLLRTLDEHYGPLPASSVIAPGRSVTDFTAGEKAPFVMGVGALGDESRNIALLAKVAPRLPWPVKIAGAGSDRRETPDSALDPEGPILLGRLGQARMAALYGQAAIFAAPSRYEAFGLHIHEAALSECALVLSDLPPLRELWGGAAIFVPPDDEEALRTTLCTLMNQPELCALLALRAYQRAVHHSSTRMVKRHLDVYRKLLAQRMDLGRSAEGQSAWVS